jgi:hypothetical protein
MILSSTVQSKTSCLAMGKAMCFAIQKTVVWFQGHKQISNFHLLLTTLLRKLVSFTNFSLSCDCLPALPFIVHWHSQNTAGSTTVCLSELPSMIYMTHALHSQPHRRLSASLHAPAPSPSKLFQHSQKLVSHHNAHLEAILAHFLSDCTNPTQLLF